MPVKRAVWTLARNIEEVTAGTCLVAIILVTLFNIVNRYLLQQSAAWAPELAGFIFTWTVFLGVSAAAKRGMHVRMGVVVDRLGTQWQARWRIVVEVLLAAFFAYAAYLAAKLTLSSYTRLSPVMRLPYSYVYASAALCFATMFARTTIDLARLALTLRNGGRA